MEKDVIYSDEIMIVHYDDKLEELILNLYTERFKYIDGPDIDNCI